MNKHVPKLEACKKLKELGYPQKTEFYFIKTGLTKSEWIAHISSHLWEGGIVEEVCSMPLATELLEWLSILPSTPFTYAYTMEKHADNSFILMLAIK